MRFEIILAPEALDDILRLDARMRTEVRERIERHLRYEPTKLSRTRIKRLRGLTRPQYRLRVQDVRVFYDVVESVVQVLAIVPKDNTTDWLDRWGESNEEDPAR